MSMLISWVVAFWGKAAPVAKRVSLRSHCIYTPDGQSFSLSWGPIYGQRIFLEKLQLQVIKESQELTQSLTELFPYIDFSTFALSKIVDDTESLLSLFYYPENRAYFQPFIDLILTHLGHDDTSNPDVEPTTPVFDSKGECLLGNAWRVHKMSFERPLPTSTRWLEFHHAFGRPLICCIATLPVIAKTCSCCTMGHISAIHVQSSRIS